MWCPSDIAGPCHLQVGLSLNNCPHEQPIHLVFFYFFTGTLQKPSIWAHPGSVMTLGSSVTIWCEGSQETQRYVLCREGSQESWNMQVEKDHNNKANFTIPSVSQLNAGQYRCYFYTSFAQSETSDILELVRVLSGVLAPDVTLKEILP